MKTNVFILAAVAAITSSAAIAQTTAFDNREAAINAVDDLDEAITDDARDIGRIGNDGREIGSYGSVALRATSTSSDGNSDSDISVGLRYGTFDGVNGFDVVTSFAYSDGDTTTDKTNLLLIGLDYRRDFNASLFAYGQADLKFDKEATDATDIKQDIFVGAGLGYRIFNDANNQWSVQAGPGYRLAQYANADEISEAAGSVSSNFFKGLTDTTYVTNDTDVIYSETSTTVKNELALNVDVTEALTLRTSYATSYDDSTDSSFSDAQNIFGVTAIYNFN